jgi:amino acid adenylation domain-containing protein/non-ribosomal peptide synthase protein (TIGR01720 family)
MNTATREAVFAFPASIAQQRLWLLDQIDPGDPTYNISAAVRFRGNLDRTILQKCLNEVVRRHESLRTIFRNVDGKLSQIIVSGLHIEIPLMDLNTGNGDSESAIQENTNHFARQRFNLATGPLLRSILLRCGPQDHVFLLAIHHSIADGWSMTVLVREVMVLYPAFCNGEPSPLPELRFQYVDFTDWQTRWLTDAVLDREAEFWRDKFTNLSVLDLPRDYALPASRKHLGRRASCVLTTQLTASLNSLSRQQGVTLFMTLLAAFKVLLYRHTGSNDIVVGSPVAGRRRREVEELIGCFLNTLVLRTQLAGDISFMQLLKRVKAVVLEAYAHQDVPVEKILERINPERKSAGNSHFQVFFNMLSFPDQMTVELPGVTADVLEMPETGSKFDITIYAGEKNGNIHFDLIYDAELFAATRMAEMLPQFEMLLGQISQDPDQQIAKYSLITEEAKSVLPDPCRQLSAQWYGPVHALFSAQVEQHGGRIAVADSRREWKYRQLDQYSNQLANWLVTTGIHPHDVVAIYGCRDAALVLAILGVMKSGAAFLVLDPSYPAARLVEYVRETQPKVFLKLEAAGSLPLLLSEFLARNQDCCQLKLPSEENELAEKLQRFPDSCPEVPVGPEDLAYVAFTSGSSGKPKGVMGKHGSLTHFLPWLKAEFRFTEDDRFSLLAALSHDPLHRDIFPPLTIGASVIVPDGESWKSPGRLVQWIGDKKISVCHLTPALTYLFAETKRGADSCLDSLRYVFFGGDLLTRQNVAEVAQWAPHAKFVNYYGATETQRALSFFRIPSDRTATAAGVHLATKEKEVVPLGQGFADVQLLVVNSAGLLAGVGEIGEIYFRSPHIALGYLSDPELTRKKFLSNWFSADPRDLLYRTGDLARYLPDGNVEALGRTDSQIKIRGYRIELEEVEATLQQYSEVQSAAAIAAQRQDGSRYLAAYVVLRHAVAGWEDRLRSFVAERLPHYMIPAVLVELPAIPLANGKVDRRVLSVPEIESEDRSGHSPRTIEEEILCSIWREVLDRKIVCTADNFFALGGHSLLAVQLISRVHDIFHVEVSLQTLFEAPTLAAFAEQIRSIGQKWHRPPIQPRTHKGDQPLSYAQQRLWFIDQLDGGSVQYNMPGALRVRRGFDEDIAEQVLSCVIQRHEALRTVFLNGKEGPLQRIQESFTFRISRIDLSALQPDEQEQAVRNHISADARRPFNLAADLMLRASFLRLSQDEGVMLFNMHHIASDGWSVGVLVKEFAQLYAAFAQGHPNPLPPLRVQYADYAQWQREWLSGDVLETQWSYWKLQLAGVPEVHSLPLDRPRPMTQTFNGASCQFNVDGETLEAVRMLALDNQATLFMVLHSVFALLLARHSNSSDIVIGTPVANRVQKELEPLVGFFANTVVLRTNCSGGRSFRDYLSQIRKVNLEAQTWQDLPFEYLVDKLKTRRNASHPPVVQIVFSLARNIIHELQLGDSTFTLLEADRVHAKFDLALEAVEEVGQLKFTFPYNRDLFDHASITRMGQHFKNLLHSVIADPLQKIEELPMLGGAEQQYLLQGLNETYSRFTQDLCVHELFEAQVERNPLATAVTFENQDLSYGELNASANQLAHYLRSQGVAANALVGLFVERSSEMVVGILGILKAGAAYVPLDPKYPGERIQYMIADSKPAVVLTQSFLVDRLSEIGVPVLQLDANREVLSRFTSENPRRQDVGLSPDHLAYVIYTSGSTGRPKGVMVEHRQVQRLFAATEKDFRFGANDVWTLFHSYAFDFSVWELWGALAYGGRLVVVPQWITRSPEDFYELLVRERVSILNQTPTAFMQLAQVTGQQSGKLKLRVVVFGGEALNLSELRSWVERHGDENPMLVNMYGITETTVHVTYRRIRREDISGHQGSVIGRPLADLRVYLFDAYQKLVPVGTLGEMYVGGDGVARGYLNRPELTNERFIENPYVASERIYRSGDLARRLPQGELEYLGRMDDQIKIRGYRIELGEIEEQLAGIAGVRAAVVVAREDEAGEKRLVGYVVRERGGVGAEEVGAGELRRQLKQKLPEYMVPGQIVFLAELPLTANGKVDRKGLPRPEGMREEASRYVGPKGEVEEILCRVWREVLRVEQVGVEDNFFELGGDSILSIQVVARARAAGVQVTPRQMFEQQTVRGLAGVAGKVERVAGEQGRVGGRVPLTPIQAAFFEWGLECAWHYNQWVLLELKPGVESEGVEAAVEALLRQHDGLRMRYVRRGEGGEGGEKRERGGGRGEAGVGEWEQWCEEEVGGGVYGRVDLRGEGEEEEQREALERDAEQVQGSFDLEAGGLVKAVEYEMGERVGKRLLLVAHHLVVDGVSWRILLEDLERGYQQWERGRRGEEIDLGEKTSSYKRWGERLEEYGGSAEVKEEEGYWCGEQWEERAGVEGIPVDYEGVGEEENVVETQRSVGVVLEEEETRELLQEVGKVYHTQINDVLLTGLWGVMREWSGGEGVLVEMEGHGREEGEVGEVDLSRTVGWFTSLYPVVLRVKEGRGEEGGEGRGEGGGMVWGERLKSIKEQLRRVPGHGFGYGVLKYMSGEGGAGEKLRRGREAEISFNYLGQFDQVIGHSKVFGVAGERGGGGQSGRNRRRYVVEISGMVVEGRLRMEWKYSERLHRRETIAGVAQRYVEILREMMEECRREGAGGYTPSDFPLAGMRQEELDRWIGKGEGVEDIYRLTPMQAGMLFHTLYEPGEGAYFNQMGCRMEGLEVEPFRRAWAEVMKRHAILRTGFVWEGVKEAVQVVRREVELPWREEDWRGEGEEEQRRKWREYLEEDQRRGFDLREAPLLRLAVMRVGERSYYFGWSNHHILYDGWCRQIVMGEVFRLYEGYVKGEEVELGRVGEYREYIEWLGKQDEEAAASFWREELQGMEGRTRLWIEEEEEEGRRRELEAGEQEYERKWVGIRGEVKEKLEEMGKREQVTMNTVVQGAWGLLLSRYSGEEEVVFGATVSGRGGSGVEGIEGMVGLFINTLPVRVEVRGEERLGEYMRRLQRKQAEARQYEYSGLGKVQEWSGVGRGKALFDTIVVFENYPVDQGLRERAGRSLRIEEVSEFLIRNSYALTLRMNVGGQQLLMEGIYQSRRFRGEKIERLLEHLGRLLEGMVEGGEKRVGAIGMMGEEEKRQIVEEWNRTEEEYGGEEKCIQEWIEEQAERVPEAEAVVYEAERVSYGELNERANQLAHYLRKLGVKQESAVGLCVERSVEMMVGVLGILKAGGAYVPLDCGYPEERLRYMVEDAGTRVIVTQGKLKAKVGSLVEDESKGKGEERGEVAREGEKRIRVVYVDEERKEIEKEARSNPERRSGMENLAYVIYTSGSTGRPKGVEIEQRQLVNYVQGVKRRLGLEGARRYATVSTLAADLGNTMIYPALVSGGSLHVISEERVMDGERLGEYFEREKIDYLKIVPSHMGGLYGVAGKGVLPRKKLIVGGEGSWWRWVEEWEQGREECRIVNHYGPTETTVGVLTYAIEEDKKKDRDKGSGSRMVPLGRPLGNTQVYVLDREMELVPVGVAGELYIGGAGVGRGYRHSAVQTAERFVPNRFSGKGGERLYRTGDRVRYVEDGNIEFLGRVDQQVKVRGYRVELGEIEAVLSGHEAVEQAVVVVREDEPGEKRLTGYVVGRSRAGEGKGSEASVGIGTEELRSYLQQRLPEHMVPAAIVVLRELPLTANGKVDRKGLPRPEGMREEASRYVGPKGEVEEILCRVWREVLRVEQVGVEDNFFELGGDSILSIQVVARARAAGVQVTPRQMFEQQTIAALAKVCGSTDHGAKPQETLSGQVPLTPIQVAFFSRQLPKPEHYTQAVMLELQPQIDSSLLSQAVRALVKHHDALRMQYRETNGFWQQWCMAEAADDLYQQHDLSHIEDEGEKTAELARKVAEVQSSLNLQKGPVVQAAEFELGPRGKRLLLVAHHLVVDGVSWRILLEDLEVAYQQLKRGVAIDLGPKTTSYRQWAERLQSYSGEKDLAREAAYWRDERRTQPKPLPLDYEGVGRNQNRTATQRSLTVSLNTEETSALLHDVPQIYHTQVNDVLLTALARVCGEWIDSDTVLLYLEGHGREDLFADVDLSRTVGWFTSVYPVVLESIHKMWDARRALRRTKEQLRRVPNRGLGYGVLRYLSSDDSLRKQLEEMPQAEIRFNYLGQFDQVFRKSQLFAPAKEPAGEGESGEDQRPYFIDISAMVVRGELRITWRYSEKLHRRESIENIAKRYLGCLRELSEHCRTEEAGGFTPSDFPLIEIEQHELDRWIGAGKNIEDIYALSPMQQGLLFESLYEPNGGVYFNQLSCRIQGVLDVGAFRRAWQEVVHRHAILRTYFLWEGIKSPVQVVCKQAQLPWKEEDWRHLRNDEQQLRWQQYLAEDRKWGFDLSQAPLLRLSLICTGDRDYFFSWSDHHLLLDGWSHQVVTSDVFSLYFAFINARAAELERAPAYREYIAWLHQQDAKQAETFWRNELAGFSAPCRLWFEKIADERLLTGAPEFAEETISLDDATTGKLENVARQQQITLNTVIQGAWSIVLGQHSGTKDVVFGATVSGRTAAIAGMEKMVGLFINTLPVRAWVRGDQQLGTFLQKLQAKQAEARQYEYSPLLQVQEWSDVPRGVPLFNSILVFENYPTDAGIRDHATSELKVSHVERSSWDTYPLTLLIHPSANLTMRIEYRSELYDTADIQRLMQDLWRVLTAIAIQPQQRISEIDFLTEREKRQLREWNQTAVAYPVSKCLHELFEHQVEQQPDAAAVEHNQQQLTYRQLNSRANQLARHLRQMGVMPESRVAICMERNPTLIIALLAVLKAGGAYVPLDPNYPPERLRYMLQDSEASLVLTQSAFQKDLQGGGAWRVVCVNEEPERVAGNRKSNMTKAATEKNLAYVIYTSGSTGRPKGVMITHQNAVAFLHWARQIYSKEDLKGMAASTSTCFDLSIFEIFAPLSSGGAVILLQNALEAGEVKAQAGMTLLNTVPSAIAELLKAGKIPATINTINLAGEALPPALVHQLYQQPGIDRVYNLYGPTEDTTYSTFALLERECEKAVIGKPVANTQVHVLDEELASVPMGGPGELFIGGDGLARGYLNRPDLTAERFIPNPFSQKPGERLYRTGDLVKQQQDGNLQFLGRLDHQVKIRGYRIELGEVEESLRQHCGVEQVVVMVRDDQAGNKQLAGYIVLKKDAEAVSGQDLRNDLKGWLPEYMLPDTITVLDKMPLTPNGKVDRKALPEPHVHLEHETYFAPGNEIEETLCGIWAEVLGLTRRIGANENFFMLGGNSLLCLRAVTRAGESGLLISLKQMFEHQTVRELSDALKSNTGEAAALQPHSFLVPVRSGGKKHPIVFLHPAGGGVDYLWPLARRLSPDQPVYGIRSRALTQSNYHPEVEQMAAEYIEHLKRIQRPPYFLGAYSLGVHIAFEMARQLTLQGEQVGLLALIDGGTHTPLTRKATDLRFLERVASTAHLTLAPEQLENGTFDQRLESVLQQVQSRLNPWEYSQLVRIAPAWYSHETAVESYLRKLFKDPASYIYPGKITLFRTQKHQTQPENGASVLEESIHVNRDPAAGWSMFSTQPIDIRWISGDHHSCVMEPHVQTLADELTLCLHELGACSAKAGTDISPTPNHACKEAM